MTNVEQFNELIARTSIDNLSNKAALQLIGTLVNLSSDPKLSEGSLPCGVVIAGAPGPAVVVTPPVPVPAM